MSVVQTFETTIVSSDVEHPAQAFVVPKRTLEQMPSASLDDISEVLGLRLGVEVPSADLLPTVFFASMAGRIQPFDAGSFERWARQMKAEDPRAEFARQLAFDDLLPVESSPLEKVSLASLTARGPAYVIGGSRPCRPTRSPRSEWSCSVSSGLWSWG